MYDQVTWNASVDKMLIYDIGMTGEFLGETEALATLAGILNKSDDVALLKARQADMAAKVQQHLWSEEDQIYLNFQQDTNTFNSHTSPTSFYPMLSGTATVEQALAMTRRWLTNHSGYCLGNSSSNPMPPAPPSTHSDAQSFSTWWSSKLSDNAICIRGGMNCDKAAAARSLDTSTVDAKHRSARADVHFGDCCPLPMHQKDGLAPPVLDPSYEFMRTEAYLLPSASDIASAGDPSLVELQMFYSHDNHDNFVGTNASKPGYQPVVGCSVDEKFNLSTVPARIFKNPPNASYVPMDLYWSEKRKDYQNVASEATRHWLCTKPACGSDYYVFVQRLGFVMIADGGWKPGQHNRTTMGPCRYSLPSTPNDDPAYKDNSYWRGRECCQSIAISRPACALTACVSGVWGPLNYLVYRLRIISMLIENLDWLKFTTFCDTDTNTNDADAGTWVWRTQNMLPNPRSSLHASSWRFSRVRP
jgi:hypothetical protein